MSWQSLYIKTFVAAVSLTSIAGEAAAWGYRVHAPEIDGPAGVAAVALLVSAGIMAYNRYRK